MKRFCIFQAALLTHPDQEMIWVAQPAVEFAREWEVKKGDANMTLTS